MKDADHRSAKRSQKPAPADAEGPLATYLYGLVSRQRRPSAARAPAGLPGMQPPRLIDAGDGLWIVAATAPLDRYGAAPIERGLRDLDWVSACALAHEAVVEHFSRAGTMVPMKLFTLFSDDRRALAHIARMRRGIDRAIERVAGCAEWGVRVSFDLARARTKAREEAGRAAGGLRSGTGFLVARKQQQDALHRMALGSREEADRVFDELTGHARAAHRRSSMGGVAGVAGPEGATGSRLLLDAVFLVPGRAASAFRAATRREAARLGREGYGITLTGPWPPYSFVAEPR